MPVGEDGKFRCFGTSPVYERYHDIEWGVPVHDDRVFFEFLILEGAQAGLNWETILMKRDGYRAQFHDFDPVKVARMSDAALEAAGQNTGIIRNRLKILSARKNAQVFLTIQDQHGSFDSYVWEFVGGAPKVNNWERSEDVPVTTPVSDALSRDLKRRGMSFVGSTIIYAFMQATGLVNDHLTGCWRHAQSQSRSS